MLEERLFTQQLRMDTSKLSDFWLSPVPTKTKAGHVMEQRLFTQQLRRGTLKLSDFWLCLVRTRTKSGQMLSERQNGHLEVVRFLVESGATKDRGWTDYGATPLCAVAENGLQLFFFCCCSFRCCC